jgi:hypothetical protein
MDLGNPFLLRHQFVAEDSITEFTFAAQDDSKEAF